MLFFDLVYVFAIGQLSHHLLEHVDLRTGAERRRSSSGLYGNSHLLNHAGQYAHSGRTARAWEQFDKPNALTYAFTGGIALLLVRPRHALERHGSLATPSAAGPPHGRSLTA